MGTTFEGVQNMSLNNTNHPEIYVVHIDANKIQEICNFYDRVFGS